MGNLLAWYAGQSLPTPFPDHSSLSPKPDIYCGEFEDSNSYNKY